MKITIQDAMDTELYDNNDFLVQESTTKQESVVKNKGDAQTDNTPKLSIEPDDGYEVDRSHDK
jgi:hypothetical protein